MTIKSQVTNIKTNNVKFTINLRKKVKKFFLIFSNI